MGRQAAVVLYALALVTLMVGVDVLFFRNRFCAQRARSLLSGQRQ
jgi:hypothetical protein